MEMTFKPGSGVKVISHSPGVNIVEPLTAKGEDIKTRSGFFIREQVEMKAELMKEAEAMIDELMAWNKETQKPNLRQVEEIILKLRQKMSEQMAQKVIEGQESVHPVPGPVCDGCGKEMNYKGHKKKTITSWVGEVALERSYYYCNQCRTGLFPPR